MFLLYTHSKSKTRLRGQEVLIGNMAFANIFSCLVFTMTSLSGDISLSYNMG